jgi:Cu-Zn family superoxide dismutase
MEEKLGFTIAFLVPVVLFNAGCASMIGNEQPEHVSDWSRVKQAVTVIHPTEGNDCRGVVHFTQVEGGVHVLAQVHGLNPGPQHGIHIHEFGDCTAPDGTSAGGHYNPENHDHGLPATRARHAGDLGNLTADENGEARYEITVQNVSIAGLQNPIIGRGVIVHAQEDDGGQPTGNAGARIGCGVIGVKGSAQE